MPRNALAFVLVLLFPALGSSATLSGQVVRDIDSSTVAFAHVIAYGADLKPVTSIDAAGDGSFSLAGIPNGTYYLFAEGDIGDNLVPNFLLDDATGEALPLQVSGDISGLVIALEPGGTISGRIVEASTGQPLGGVAIQASRPGEDALARYGVSDVDGRYAVNGLAEQDYGVLAHSPDHVIQIYDRTPHPEAATPVSVVPGEVTTDVDFKLRPAGRITGRVIDSNGNPLEDIWVGAFLDEDRWIFGAGAFTGADGRYVIGSVLPGDAFVVAFDPAEIWGWSWWDAQLDFNEAATVSVLAGTISVDIDFTLFQPGIMGITPASLTFSGLTFQDDLPAQTLTVTNSGPGPIAVGAWTEVDWLCLDYDPEGVILNAGEDLPIEVTAWTWGLTPGTYTAPVRILDYVTGRLLDIPVQVDLSPSPPQLVYEPSELWLETTEGAAGSVAELWAANIGDGAIPFTATVDQAWLSVSPESGSFIRGRDPVRFTVSLTDPALAVGSHSGTLTLTTPSGAPEIPVTVLVEPEADGEPIVNTTQSIMILVPGGNSVGAATLATETIDVSNTGTGTLHWNARSGSEWLTVSPPTGSLAAGAATTLTLTADAADLANGVSSTHLDVSSSHGQKRVEVGLQVGREADVATSVRNDPDGQLVVPVLVHAAGAFDSRFVSDLWIAHRPSGRAVETTLSFIPDGADGTQNALVTPLTFRSGQTISLIDVMENWLGGAFARGTLVIQSDQIDEMEAVSRTYNQSDDGTLGQEIPAISSQRGITAVDGLVQIPGLRRDPAFRSNVLITEVGGATTTVRLTIRDSAGAELGQTDITVPAFSTKQLNDAFGAVGHVGDAVDARAQIEVLSGSGRIAALGSIVDNATNDPTTVVARKPSAGTSTWIVPVVAHAAGAAGTQWVSDLTITNADPVSRKVTLTWRDTAGVAGAPITETLAPDETRTWKDVVSETFGVAAGRGSVVIDANPKGGLVIDSRTYNQGPSGTFGQGVQGVARSRALDRGPGLIRLIGLHNTPRYRTNIGITEVGGSPVTIGLLLRDASGQKVLGYREVDIPAGGQFQANIFSMMGADSQPWFAATAIIQVISGDGSVLAYASMVDNDTGDGTTLPPPDRVRSGDGGGIPDEASTED